MIKVELESSDFKDLPAEDCCFCGTETRYWFLPKDVAVCPDCAKGKNPQDVPNKTEWAVKVLAKLDF